MPSSEDAQAAKNKQIKYYLHEALSVSSQAVQADSNLNSDPIRSHSLYKECSHRIEHVIPFLPDEYADILGKFSKVYLERANRLRDQITGQEYLVETKEDLKTKNPLNPNSGLVSGSSQGGLNQNQEYGSQDGLGNSTGNVGLSTGTNTLVNTGLNDTPTKIEFEIQDIPEFSHSEYQKIPADMVRRPFWLMNLLSTSIKSGAHISPNLYISRDVWFQKKISGKHLQNLHVKMMFCERLYIMLKELSLNQNLLFSGTNKESTYAFLGERLDDFMKKAEKEYELLSKTIQNSKTKKLFALGKIYSRVFSTNKKGANVNNNETNLYEIAQQNSVTNGTNQGYDNVPYVPVLSKLFDHCQYLDDWFVHVVKYQKSLPSDSPEAFVKSVKNVRQLLESIAIFLYFRLCGFVLSDLHILLEYYLRQMRDSFEYMT